MSASRISPCGLIAPGGHVGLVVAPCPARGGAANADRLSLDAESDAIDAAMAMGAHGRPR
ncbi:MAG TPA: hypothetical protein VN222_09710 [Novosphingobium sp.]|nr:hypothetical protein [Novosphingobium sp.]